MLHVPYCYLQTLETFMHTSLTHQGSFSREKMMSLQGSGCFQLVCQVLKQQITRKKVPLKLDFTYGSMELRKKDRNKAEMKGRKKTTGHLQKYEANVRQSSCVLSSLPCFCPFFSPISEVKFQRNFFPWFSFFFKGFQTTFQIDDQRIYCAADEHFGVRRKNVFCTIAQNAFFLLQCIPQ